MNLTRWEPFKDADDFFRNYSPSFFGRWRLPGEVGSNCNGRPPPTSAKPTRNTW